jgi:hypothetical protein
MKYRYVLMVLLITCFSCGKLLKTILGDNKVEKPTFHVSGYDGGEIKVDGYYLSNSDSLYYDIIILYRSGYLNYFSASRKDYFYVSEIDSIVVHAAKFDAIDDWGVFSVENSRLIVELWSMREGRKPLWHYDYKILNDSTFTTDFFWRAKDPSEKFEYNRIFAYRPVPHKPDSTYPTYISPEVLNK